jgi:CRISPR-associated protein Cas5d
VTSINPKHLHSCCTPELRWRPVAVEVLKPIREFTVRRNETTDLPGLVAALREGRRVDTAGRGRTQRTSVCLRDVAYRIHAQVDLLAHATKPAAAYRDQFRRRVVRGACFQQPYLGCREFVAYFGEPDAAPPVDVTEDLGFMVHSITYTNPPRYGWFRAHLERGVVHIPERGVDGRLVGITGQAQAEVAP